MKIKDELNKLKSADIYSLMLFALFKIKDVPEYSALSELAYVLDKKNLLRLCEYFGGLTITIPTIADLESMIYILVLYQLVDIDGMSYEDAIKEIGFSSSDLRRVKSDYVKMKEILDNYDFKR